MHSSFFQLGSLHIPVYGVFAALGLMAALALSQKTARYVGLDADKVWDAGITTAVATFVISRLLLVVFNWRSFLQYPMLLLEVPSLTSIGVALTGLFMLGYLRWRRMPLLQFLDAVTPCSAVLWMFLSIGRFAEGTRDGMPTHMPWGVLEGAMVRVHPVEIYTMIAAGSLCVGLLRLLQRKSFAGKRTGMGLVFAGIAVFFIDFFRLPSDLIAEAWLDPAQVIAFVMITSGGVLLLRGQAKIQGAAVSIEAEARSENTHAV